MRRSISPARVCLLASIIFCSSYSSAQAPAISYSPLITGLNQPIDIVSPGDGTGRLFVVEREGLVRVWNGSTLLATPFINMATRITAAGSEQGLLSMAFHPDYENNGYFFLYYTNPSGAIELARGKVSTDPNLANNDSIWVLMTIPKPFANHNGGDLNFGPDGMLYFATGDGGSANDPGNNAQTGTSRLGKMLRLNVDSFHNDRHYVIPPDNPFIGNAAFDSAVYAYGLRNPFRWSFDRQTGNMWIGDVGQDLKEEVNLRPAGATAGVNYGWRCFEGTVQNAAVTPACDPANDVLPIFEYDNPVAGPAAVTGGFVYRGPDYPNFRGYYISTDVYSGNIYLVYPDGAGGYRADTQTSAVNTIVAFGEDEDGTLYAASLGTGTVYTVVATGGIVLPVTLSGFSVHSKGSYNELQWTTSFEQNTARFYIEYGSDGTKFHRAGSVMASRNSQGSSYLFRHHHANTGDVFYRLAIQDDDGQTKYSSILRLSSGKKDSKVYPTVVKNQLLQLELGQPTDKIQLLAVSGTIVYDRSLKGFTGSMLVQLPPGLSQGIYLLRIVQGREVRSEKIIID